VLDQFFQEVVGPVHDDEMMTPRKAHESLVGRDDARAIPLGKLDRRLLIVRAMERNIGTSKVEPSDGRSIV